MYIRIPNFQSEINRKRLIKKARILGILYAEHLSNKSLLKIVNTHNTDKKLIRIFNELGKRTVFTNSEIDKAIELYGLEIDDLKEIARHRKINNYSNMSKEYALLCISYK